MTVPEIHETLHVVVPGVEMVEPLLEAVGADSELAVALLDPRLTCIWANRTFVEQASPLVGGGAIDGLIVTSGAVPRWSRASLRAGVELAIVVLELQRGRNLLQMAVVPVLDPSSQVVGLLALSSPTAAASPELVSPASWSRWLDTAEVAVAASDRLDRVVLASRAFVERVGQFQLADRCSDQLLERVLDGDREGLLAAKWAFLGGRATAGRADVRFASAADEAGQLWQQVWLTVMHGDDPVLRLDLFTMTEAADETVWGRASAALEHAVTLVQSCPDPLLLVDRGRVVSVTPASESCLGWFPDQMVGQRLEALVTGDDAWHELLEEVNSGVLTATTRCEARVQGASGDRVPAELTVAPVAQEQGAQSVVLVHRLDGSRREDDIATLSTMLSVSDVVTDDRGRLAEPLDIFREAFAARRVELICLDPVQPAVLDCYVAPVTAEEPVRSAKLLADLHGLLTMTGGPMLMDAAETDIAGQLAAQLVPVRQDASWLLQVTVQRQFSVSDRYRLRRFAQVLAWIIDRATEARRADRLARERSLIAHALHCASAGVMVVDCDGTIVASNEALERLFGDRDLHGVTLSELVGRSEARELESVLVSSSKRSWSCDLVRETGWSGPMRLRLLLEVVRGADRSFMGAIGR